MRFRYLAGLALTAMVANASVIVAQTVQTFEDIPCGNTPFSVYGPVNYNNLFTCYSFAQYPYTPHSGTNRIYTTGNTNSGIFNFVGGTATFDGAWFAGYSSNSVSFILSLAGVPVWTSGSLTPTDVPTFLSSGYSGQVDQVQVLGTGDLWIMDDVTFDTGVIGPVPVPEPASMALMGSGLLSLYGFARRRRNGPGRLV